MKNFDLSLNEEIHIYIKTGLTPTELFVLRLLFLAIDGDTSYLVNYVTNISNGKTLLKNVLISLKDKNVINSTFKIPEEGESLNFKNIPINKNFLKSYIKESHYIGKEFFDAYPNFITINNKVVSIKNFTKADANALFTILTKQLYVYKTAQELTYYAFDSDYSITQGDLNTIQKQISLNNAS